MNVLQPWNIVFPVGLVVFFWIRHVFINRTKGEKKAVTRIDGLERILVQGRIFATLGPKEGWGMVKLTADRQASYVRAAPDAFEQFSGAWGRRGATKIYLADAQDLIVRQALIATWRNTAPKRLAQQFDED